MNCKAPGTVQDQSFSLPLSGVNSQHRCFSLIFSSVGTFICKHNFSRSKIQLILSFMRQTYSWQSLKRQVHQIVPHNKEYYDWWFVEKSASSGHLRSCIFSKLANQCELCSTKWNIMRGSGTAWQIAHIGCITLVLNRCKVVVNI